MNPNNNINNHHIINNNQLQWSIVPCLIGRCSVNLIMLRRFSRLKQSSRFISLSIKTKSMTCKIHKKTKQCLRIRNSRPKTQLMRFLWTNLIFNLIERVNTVQRKNLKKKCPPFWSKIYQLPNSTKTKFTNQPRIK